ncbi:MAG: DPP IV N-terminal domain-containing protein [Bacteroidaceae bacterium]|nr:DPP IV N-terminal domain-containing protein [Bacteroidaceae bacterium]
MNIFKGLTLAALLLAGAGNLVAQGTVEDYKRAYSLRGKFTSDKVYYSGVSPRWIGDTHTFWYVRHTPEGDRYVKVDADKQTRTDLFNHDKLATALAKSTGRKVDGKRLNLQSLSVNERQDTLRFQYDGKNFTYAIKKNRLEDKGRIHYPQRGQQRHWMEVDDEKGGRPVTSPDGKHEAFIKNDNIYIRNRATGRERALSIDGTLGNYYSSYIQWSPDSRYVFSARIRPVEKRYVYYVESSPKDQLQPKLHKQEYAKPGDELRSKVPCIYEVETGRAIIPSTELFDKQYELFWFRWNEQGTGVTFEYNERGHQVYRLLELSAETGKVRTVVEEKSNTFVNHQRMYRRFLCGGNELIWMSERDNWNHLYLYDYATGKVKNQITKGPWYVREVLHVDEEARQIYFTANGMEVDNSSTAKEDPYLIRYYRINFDGTDLTCLTPDEGNHTATFSRDRKYLVDVHSLVDRAPEASVRRVSDGSLVMPLEKADITKLLETGWRAPEVFVAKGRDGKTDMWGIIVRPTNFDPNKKYPIIEYIYAGPGSHYVPKSFSTYNYNMTALAELGFIVVQLDGMGTSFRSKEFEDVCYKNLKDAGFPDRKAWIRAAAEKYPYMDIDSVGIFGASAGGQESTTAVLLHPEFYKAAYSACGCHDNRMDKIWWNEQWLGYPLGDQYKEGSNVENAHLLSRPLMLVVGELDDNVDPASTMQVVDALIRANKDFELVVLPGVGHTMGESYGEHKRYDFFVRHLMGVNPPKWDEVK